MKSARPIQGLLVIWALWEFLNASLSTFAPALGASFVGWTPKGGWSTDLAAMSQQYGMVLFLLGGAYLAIARDPVRYRAFVWIPIAEQGLGIAYALFGLIASHTMTGGQFATQAVINIVIAALFFLLRPGTPEPSGVVRTARA
jgi:hypothetical protein